MNISRQNYGSISPYEKTIGFSRAVRIGNVIAVAGTAPIMPNGSSAAPGDIYQQTIRCLEIIRKSVETAGGQLSDVIRTRIFLTDISKWEDVGKAHGSFFKGINPVCTMVEVNAFVNPDWLVEIEADAIIRD